MKQITSNAELIPGNHYWCRDKRYGDVTLQECNQESYPNEQWKYLGRRIWAMDDNNQALERWDIVGPLPKPAINFDEFVNHKDCGGFD